MPLHFPGAWRLLDHGGLTMSHPATTHSLIFLVASLLMHLPTHAQGTYTNAVGGFAFEYDALKYSPRVGWDETFFSLDGTGRIHVEGESYRINPVNNWVYTYPPHCTRSDSVRVVGIYNARSGCSSDGDSGSTRGEGPDSVSTFTNAYGLTVFRFRLTYIETTNGNEKRSLTSPYYVVDISKGTWTRGLLISVSPGEYTTPEQEKELENIVKTVTAIESIPRVVMPKHTGKVEIGQWEQLPGPLGGRASHLVSHKRRLFTIVNQHLFVTSDNGVTWARGLSEFGNARVAALCSFQNRVIVASYEKGILMSTDDGVSWALADSTLKKDVVDNFLTVGDKVYAATSQGMLVSNDGRVWKRMGERLKAYVHLVAVQGATLVVGDSYGRLHISIDSGTTWNPTGEGVVIGVAQAFLLKGSSILACTNNGIFISPDRGKTWRLSNEGIGKTAVLALYEIESSMLVGTGKGLFKSNDGGQNWELTGVGISGRQVTSLAALGSSLFAGTDRGVYVSTDNGASWNATTPTRSFPSINALAVDDSTIFAGTDEGLFVSDDNGGAWKAIDPGLRNKYVRTLAVDRQGLVVGTFTDLFCTTNRGTKWTSLIDALRMSSCGSFLRWGNRWFAGTTDGVAVSLDSGKSWVPPDSLMNDAQVYALALAGGNLVAGTSKGAYVSRNKGNSWSWKSGVPSIDFLATKGDLIFAATWGGAFRSDDQGEHWTKINSGLQHIVTNRLAVDGNVVYASGPWGGVSRSRDDGEEWTQVFKTPEYDVVTSLAVNAHYLYAGTWQGGIWRMLLH